MPAYDDKGLRPYITAPKGCLGLNEYLKRFDLPLCVLQTAFAIEYAVSELILRLDAAGMRYAEIRFAPQLHMQNGLTQQEIVEASLCGLQKGIGSSKHMKAQLILCCMRGEDNEQENEQTVHLAKAYLKKASPPSTLPARRGCTRHRGIKVCLRLRLVLRCLSRFMQARRTARRACARR